VGVADVGVGDVRPRRFVLHTDGIAAGVHGLDQGGADAAHRVQDEIAGLGVMLDGVRGDGRQHAGRVLDRFGHVAAFALHGSGGLGGRPH
jgi:hypothetical protein